MIEALKTALEDILLFYLWLKYSFQYLKNKILTNDLLEKLIDIAERNYKKTSIKHEFIVDLLSKN